MFRLRKRSNGLWIRETKGSNPVMTEYKDKALVLPKYKLEFWENDKDYEIVPLAEDEIMARVGHPRLPGF